MCSVLTSTAQGVSCPASIHTGSVGGRCVLQVRTLVITLLRACHFPHLFCEDGKTRYKDYVIVGNTRYLLFPEFVSLSSASFSSTFFISSLLQMDLPQSCPCGATCPAV